MWQGETMTVFEAFQISMVGFSIVFLTLIALSIFVKIISSAVASVAGKQKESKPAKAQPAPQVAKKVEGKADGAIIAAIIAAVSTEMKQGVDKFKITSINEKK
ncbi:OadG family protein [Peptoniphilus catoniae]|uniref:OadG family protein n=1 Tax=Peptoniphilus catoniae TaxID=1660341 RepID=UPI0010FE4B40|nr:OadG family protein [Peptoniphilus catoniae]